MEINSFITWDMLKDYTLFVGIVFMVVQVIKELSFLKNIPTRIVSITVAFVLQILLHVNFNTFKLFDIVIYLISSIVISLTANGLADATIKFKDKSDMKG